MKANHAGKNKSVYINLLPSLPAFSFWYHTYALRVRIYNSKIQYHRIVSQLHAQKLTISLQYREYLLPAYEYVRRS